MPRKSTLGVRTGEAAGICDLERGRERIVHVCWNSNIPRLAFRSTIQILGSIWPAESQLRSEPFTQHVLLENVFGLSLAICSEWRRCVSNSITLSEIRRHPCTTYQEHEVTAVPPLPLKRPGPGEVGAENGKRSPRRRRALLQEEEQG